MKTVAYWDGRKLRAGLREANDFGVSELIQQAVSVKRYEDADAPGRFFEVEIVGVSRQRGDRLMSPPVVAEYLAQVAPGGGASAAGAGSIARDEVGQRRDASWA